MSTRASGSLVVAPSSKPGNGTLWRDIHSIDGHFSPSYVGEAIEADAILFAAAPDLLCVLRAVLAEVRAHNLRQDKLGECIVASAFDAADLIARIDGGAK